MLCSICHIHTKKGHDEKLNPQDSTGMYVDCRATKSSCRLSVLVVWRHNHSKIETNSILSLQVCTLISLINEGFHLLFFQILPPSSTKFSLAKSWLLSSDLTTFAPCPHLFTLPHLLILQFFHPFLLYSTLLDYYRDKLWIIIHQYMIENKTLR